MRKIDEAFDVSHCVGCTKECSVCQDAFFGSKVFASVGFCGRSVDTGERFVIRYAQEKARKELGLLVALGTQ